MLSYNTSKKTRKKFVKKLAKSRVIFSFLGYTRSIPTAVAPMSPSTRISSRLIFLRRLLHVSVYFSLFTLMIWASYKAAMSPYMRVWSINITGNTHISGQALHHLSDLHYGLHSWSLDLEQSEQKIQQHPWVRSAKVTWDFPSQVHIQIEEQEIVGLLALQKLWYINDEGTPFRLAQSNNLDYPIVSGIPQDWVSKHPHVVKKILSEAINILEVLETFDYIRSEDLSEIYFQKDLGFSIILHNGSKIIFGFYDPKERLERLSQMIENGLSLDEPKQIVLDAEQVAVVIPIKN